MAQLDTRPKREPQDEPLHLSPVAQTSSPHSLETSLTVPVWTGQSCALPPVCNAQNSPEMAKFMSSGPLGEGEGEGDGERLLVARVRKPILVEKYGANSAKPFLQLLPEN